MEKNGCLLKPYSVCGEVIAEGYFSLSHKSAGISEPPACSLLPKRQMQFHLLLNMIERVETQVSIIETFGHLFIWLFRKVYFDPSDYLLFTKERKLLYMQKDSIHVQR